jgi:hypothetical protein
MLMRVCEVCRMCSELCRMSQLRLFVDGVKCHERISEQRRIAERGKRDEKSE